MEKRYYSWSVQNVNLNIALATYTGYVTYVTLHCAVSITQISHHEDFLNALICL